MCKGYQEIVESGGEMNPSLVSRGGKIRNPKLEILNSSLSTVRRSQGRTRFQTLNLKCLKRDVLRLRCRGIWSKHDCKAPRNNRLLVMSSVNETSGCAPSLFIVRSQIPRLRCAALGMTKGRNAALHLGCAKGRNDRGSMRYARTDFG